MERTGVVVEILVQELRKRKRIVSERHPAPPEHRGHSTFTVKYSFDVDLMAGSRGVVDRTRSFLLYEYS